MVNQVKDLTGTRFGKMTVLSRATSNSKSGNAMWVCLCDCGNEVPVIGSHLRSGHTTSCGCNRTSNRATGHAKERIYRIWNCMNRRCNDQKDKHFQWYGARGIKVCIEWNDYSSFRSWAISNGYRDDLSIDRIDINGNYCPENCRWAGVKTQANNRRNNRLINYNGNSYTVSQMAECFNLSYWTIINRLKLGWSIEKIISTPERSATQYDKRQ